MSLACFSARAMASFEACSLVRLLLLHAPHDSHDRHTSSSNHAKVPSEQSNTLQNSGKGSPAIARHHRSSPYLSCCSLPQPQL